MASSANDKLVSALSQLAEAYAELQEELEERLTTKDNEEEEDFDSQEIDDEDALAEEVDAAMIAELKLAIDSVIDTDDVATEEFAVIFSALVDALEEIDPDCFSDMELINEYERSGGASIELNDYDDSDDEDYDEDDDDDYDAWGDDDDDDDYDEDYDDWDDDDDDDDER
ncbi:MAG: hypothetical protein ACOX3T_05670 [Bdellovibrionota bacterium]